MANAGGETSPQGIGCVTQWEYGLVRPFVLLPALLARCIHIYIANLARLRVFRLSSSPRRMTLSAAFHSRHAESAARGGGLRRLCFHLIAGSVMPESDGTVESRGGSCPVADSQLGCSISLYANPPLSPPLPSPCPLSDSLQPSIRLDCSIKPTQLAVYTFIVLSAT